VSEFGKHNQVADDAALKSELAARTAVDSACCYQCGKCTAGCPSADRMDVPSASLMRLIQLGRLREAMACESLWTCLGCGPCTARCPQNVDVAATMDGLRELAIREGVAASDRVKQRVWAFHRAFLNAVRRLGRLNEVQLVTEYKLRTRTFFQDLDVGARMFFQGKIKPWTLVIGAEKVRDLDHIERIFAEAESRGDRDATPTRVQMRRPMKRTSVAGEPIVLDVARPVGYYPGCSLGGTAKEFDISARQMCRLLGLELREIDDWNCCGASSAHATNHALATMLPARNQALADVQGFDVVLTPCAACYNRQVTTRRAVREQSALRETMNKLTGFEATGRARFINVMELLKAFGDDRLRARVVRSMAGMKVACYYGCLLVRPIDGEGFDDPENPMRLDRVVASLGAVPVPWSFKVECCGAGLTMATPELIEELTHKIVADAVSHGAEAIVVACPLCHSNLDMRQAAMRKRFGDDVPTLPVYYISELVSLACGAEAKELAIDKHFVSAEKFLTNRCSARVAGDAEQQ